MLISDEYRDLLAAMHASKAPFGNGSHRRRKYVASLGYDDILDYGCGKGTLELGRKYDPAIPEFSAEPEPADLVVCTDVLEHIEPECLDDVLKHIRSKMKKAGYFTIGCAKASKRLPDGRNAHLIIQPPEWWLERLSQFFTVVSHETRLDPAKKKKSLELEVHLTP